MEISDCVAHVAPSGPQALAVAAILIGLGGLFVVASVRELASAYRAGKLIWLDRTSEEWDDNKIIFGVRVVQYVLIASLGGLMCAAAILIPR